MLNLRLAQYSAEGKFEKFLELGEDFVYGGNYISLNSDLVVKNGRWEPIRVFFKDEKDPLNRFNGLFNGRTYGNGKFVLIENKLRRKKIEIGEGEWDDEFVWGSAETNSFSFKNLHQNPELWEKIK